MSGVLALIATDPDGGYNVLDTRDGQPVAWRGTLAEANEVSSFLNASYPSPTIWPAHDTLAHEVLCWRVGGSEAPLETVSQRCPWGVPSGPGWDHLIA